MALTMRLGSHQPAPSSRPSWTISMSPTLCGRKRLSRNTRPARDLGQALPAAAAVLVRPLSAWPVTSSVISRMLPSFHCVSERGRCAGDSVARSESADPFPADLEAASQGREISGDHGLAHHSSDDLTGDSLGLISAPDESFAADFASDYGSSDVGSADTGSTDFE